MSVLLFGLIRDDEGCCRPAVIVGPGMNLAAAEKKGHVSFSAAGPPPVPKEAKNSDKCF